MRPGTPPAAEATPAPHLGDWTVAVIGLGTMGAAMAHRLADTGCSLRVFNRSPQRAQQFADERKAVAAATPAAAADGADVVLVSVADDDALRQVLRGPAGVAAAAVAPRLVINTSTVAAATLNDLADYLPLIAAGILGNAIHARQGQLRWYVGGPAELADLAIPVVQALAQQILRFDAPASGMHLKIAMNLLMGLEMQALAEVVRLGESAGLPRDLLLDAVSQSGFAAPVMRFKARRMATDHYGDPDFRLRLMAKDLSLAVAQAARTGTDLPMTRVAADTHADATAAGYGDADCAAILQSLHSAATEGMHA